MVFPLWPGVAVLALLPAAALAQQGRQADPADVNATVPATVHVSAFAGYRPAGDPQLSPDQAWRAANEEVGKTGAHATPMAPAQAQQPEAHAGHGSHHNMQGK